MWATFERYIRRMADVMSYYAQIGERVGKKYFIDAAPKLPHDVQMFVAKILPYGIVIVLIALVPLLLSWFGVGALMVFVAPLKGLVAVVRWVIFAVAFRLQWKAVKPLFALRLAGWRGVYHSTLAVLCGMVLSDGVVFALVGGIIMLYVLFQVKHIYEHHG